MDGVAGIVGGCVDESLRLSPRQRNNTIRILQIAIDTNINLGNLVLRASAEHDYSAPRRNFDFPLSMLDQAKEYCTNLELYGAADVVQKGRITAFEQSIRTHEVNALYGLFEALHRREDA